MVINGHYDRKTLEQVIIPRFVESHSDPAAATGQLARWRTPFCTRVLGVKPQYAEYFSARINQQARSAGAPVAVSDDCEVAGIEVVFTAQAQKQLDFIARTESGLLGSARRRDDTTMRRAIQAWYVTGTRSMNPDCGSGAVVALDAEWGDATPVCGDAGSRLTQGMESDLLHVLVIVDAGRLMGVSLDTVADYISMIALSHFDARYLDACSALPSIIDVLSPGCTQHPQTMTAPDDAFLKALYGADLEKNLNIEQADIRNRMVAELARR